MINNEMYQELLREQEQEERQEQREQERREWIKDNKERLETQFLGVTEITISESLDVDEFLEEHNDSFKAFCIQEFYSEN